MYKSNINHTNLISAPVEKKKQRNSNLELFRIITMFLIVAHHYVVNSGLTLAASPLYQNPLQLKSLFLLVFGAWGKVGINCFVLITGYFMCKSTISLIKFLRLICEVMFYRIVIYFIFVLTGYSTFSPFGLLKVLIPIPELNKGFTNTFIVFYLFIPFLSLFVKHLDEKKHIYLLILCGFTYVFMGSFAPILDVEFNYITWYIVLFFIASYIRLYPKKLFDKTYFWGWTTLFLLIVSMITVFICTWFGTQINMFSPYYFLGESNRFLAVAIAISSFLFFKNLKIKQNKLINTVAASTFAVLLIHSNSDTMRKFLWVDVVKCLEVFEYNWVYLHALCSVCLIFIICITIDFIRIRYIETPIMKKLNKKIDLLQTKYKNFEAKVLKKINVNQELI